MADCSSLFYAAGRDDTFHARITPSEEQIAGFQATWNDLGAYLQETARSAHGVEVQTLLQGSYRLHTQIRPRQDENYDVDLGVYVTVASLRVTTSAGLRDFIGRLARTYAADLENSPGSVESKKSCERVMIARGFHIDLPVYARSDEENAQRLAVLPGDWVESDARKVIDWFHEHTSGWPLALREVRYMKSWAMRWYDATTRPSSMLLSAMVVEALRGKRDDLGNSRDDIAFVAVADYCATLLNSRAPLPNPANPDDDLLQELDRNARTHLASALKRASATGLEALNEESELQAAGLWEDVFGSSFPCPAAVEQQGTTGGTLPARFPSPEVHIQVRRRSGDTSPILQGQNRIQDVPLGFTVSFRLTNYDRYPRGSEVSWTVRNTGREAEDALCLDFSCGTGTTAAPLSQYNGSHEMDCVVRLDGHLIAARRVPVSVKGDKSLIRLPRGDRGPRRRGRKR